jgi:SNF2 family DNA or RNA helicase
MSLADLKPIEYDILSEYSFPMSKGKQAFAFQKETCKVMVNNPHSYVLNDIGTGKTLCPLWAFSYLKSIGQAHKMLVIAPLSTLEQRWVAELMAHFPHLKFKVLHGTKENRLYRLSQNVDVYIINHHGVFVILPELMERKDIDTVTVDELSVYRNGKSKRLTLTLKELVRWRRWVWGLTGSPCPRAVTDVWGPATCITPRNVPAHFSWIRATLMYQVSPFKWLPKPGAEELAIKYLSPSVRYRLSDAAELPERVIQYYHAPMSIQQTKIYDEMNKLAIAMIEDQRIEALNAGAMMNKLLQIACGYVYTRSGEVVELDNTPRLQITLDLIDSCAQKVILYAPYKSVINGLHKMLDTNKIKHLIIHGDVPVSKRKPIFDLFQQDNDYKTLLAHPGCMSHGLDLVKATMIIWFGPVTSLDMFYQACGRIYRVGQMFKTLIAMVGGSARERKLYTLLASNEKVQNRFLELIQTV